MTRWPAVAGWAGVHRSGPALAVLAAVAGAGVLFARTTVSELGLIRLVAPISVLLLLPAAAGVAVAVAADNTARLPLPDPPRAVAARAAWAVAWTALAAVAAAAGVLAGAPAAFGAVARNVVVESGLALLPVRLGYPSLAWLLPFAYTFVSMMFGYPDGDPRYYWWAVVMREQTSLAQWASCGAVYAVVLVAYVARPQPLRAD